MAPNELAAAADESLRRAIDWVGNYDSKASVVLGLATAMLGTLAVLAPSHEDWGWGVLTLSALAAAFLALSLLFIHLGNYPRTKGPDSVLYFGYVATLSSPKFVERFSSRTHEEHLRDTLQQCHQVSVIVHRKFGHLRRAYFMLFAAVLPWLVSLYLYRFG